MAISRHYVSMRTYALAFAVVLSPVFLQIATCDRGNTDLSSLELEVGGQNLVQGFDAAFRSYAVSTDGSAAVATLRATSAMGNSDVNWQWWVGGVMVDSGPIGIGGGEVPLLDIPPEGLSQLRVLVEAGAPSARRGHYQVNLSRQDVFACTEQGILDAIAMGGGPHTFNCAGPTTVVMTEVLTIDNDVILDGDGNLTVDGGPSIVTDLTMSAFSVANDVTVELHGFTFLGPTRWCHYIGLSWSCHALNAFVNSGTLTVSDSILGVGISVVEGTLSVTDSSLIGIISDGTVIVTDSTVTGMPRGSTYQDTWAIRSYGALTLTNSTVSVNEYITTGIAVLGSDSATVTNSTVSSWRAISGGGLGASVTLTNTIIDGECIGDPVTSLGNNIESPGDTCGFDQASDQFDVTAAELNLGPLQNNGGPTETHALLTEPDVSVAIDQIPAVDCEVTEDQRGFPRDSMCDVGAFEVQP